MEFSLLNLFSLEFSPPEGRVVKIKLWSGLCTTDLPGESTGKSLFGLQVVR